MRTNLQGLIASLYIGDELEVIEQKLRGNLMYVLDELSIFFKSKGIPYHVPSTLKDNNMFYIHCGKNSSSQHISASITKSNKGIELILKNTIKGAFGERIRVYDEIITSSEQINEELISWVISETLDFFLKEQ